MSLADFDPREVQRVCRECEHALAPMQAGLQVGFCSFSKSPVVVIVDGDSDGYLSLFVVVVVVVVVVAVVEMLLNDGSA